jgi:hypothetical protein
VKVNVVCDHTIKEYGEVEVYIHSFLSSALVAVIYVEAVRQLQHTSPIRQKTESSEPNNITLTVARF